MECTSPLSAFQTEDGSVIFNDFGRADVVRDLTLRCGQCMACRLTSGAKWSVRCMHESKLYGDRNSFLTLTVDDANLLTVFPMASLRYEPFQLFMKRLRRGQADRVRFRMSAEYGEESGRPHYHALAFNLWPDDAKAWRKSGDGDLYRSAALEKLWPFGNVEFGRVTPETAAYVNGYVTKKLTGEQAREQYGERLDVETGEIVRVVPPFARQSTVPAIGIEFFQRYLSDFVNADGVMLRGGSKLGMPKAYDNWLEKYLPDQLEEMKFERVKAAGERYLAAPGESSPERLAVKDQVNRARVANKSRNRV